MKREEALKIAKPILFNTDMVMAVQGNKKTATRRVVKSKNVDLSTCSFVEMSMAPSETRIDRNGIEYPHDLKGLYATFEETYGEYYPLVKAPYQVGDILYVRETWKRFCGMLYGWENGTYIPLDDFEGYQYKADEQCICTKGINPLCDGFEDQKNNIRFEDKWHPSIHLPKEATRIFLRVTNVRVERLQDIITGDYKTPININREGLISPCSRCTHPNGECKDFITQNSCRLVDRFIKLWDSTVDKSVRDKYGWAANPFVWVITFERLEVET